MNSEGGLSGRDSELTPSVTRDRDQLTRLRFSTTRNKGYPMSRYSDPNYYPDPTSDSLLPYYPRREVILNKRYSHGPPLRRAGVQLGVAGRAGNKEDWRGVTAVRLACWRCTPDRTGGMLGRDWPCCVLSTDDHKKGHLRSSGPSASFSLLDSCPLTQVSLNFVGSSLYPRRYLTGNNLGQASPDRLGSWP